jgi:Cyclin
MFDLWATEINTELIQDLYNVIRNQEVDEYTCADYLNQGSNHKSLILDVTSSSTASSGIPRRTNSSTTMAVSSSENGVDGDMQDRSESSPRQQIIESWREKIVEWSYRVVDHFDLDRRVVAHSMMNLDRYLAQHHVNSWEFQLAAATSLFMSVKVSEQKLIPLSYYVNLGAGRFSAEHLLQMECDMLKALKWRVNPPTPVLQTKLLLFILPNHMPFKGLLFEIARFLTEMCVIDYFFVPFKASSIASAAVMTAIDILGETVVDFATSFHFAHEIKRLTEIDVFSKEVNDCKNRMKNSFQESGISLTDFECPSTTQNIVSPIKGWAGSDSHHCMKFHS